MPQNESTRIAVIPDWKNSDDIVSHTGKISSWLMDPVKNVLDREFSDREFARIKELFGGLLPKLDGFSSELTELYVKTEDFSRLLEQTLVRIADEHREEHRRIYRSFLIDAVISPCDPFEKQLRFLQTVQELRLDQIRMLKAIIAQDTAYMPPALSPVQNLGKQLPDILPDRIDGLLTQMDELEIISLSDLKKTAPGHKASDCLTPPGHQLLRFI